MGSVVISGATSGAITLAVPAEAGTRTLTLPATTGTVLTNDISAAGDTSAGDAAAVGYTAAEGLILTGQGSTSDVTIKNDADATVLSVATGTGFVGVGITAPTNTLHVKSPASTGAGVYAAAIENAKTDNGTATVGLRVKYTSVSPGDSNHIFQCLDSGNTVRFFVQNNGTRGGTSDRTLKENIVDATDKLTELRQLQVRNYNWIDHGPEGGFKELGFIAQEVEAIFPKMIRENPETGKKMLLDSVFIPILVKSLQEAADKIDALETRIAALEA